MLEKKLLQYIYDFEGFIPNWAKLKYNKKIGWFIEHSEGFRSLHTHYKETAIQRVSE